ncbi:MAG: hypothetical protein AAFV53_42345 [Myxococcota bacterium]
MNRLIAISFLSGCLSAPEPDGWVAPASFASVAPVKHPDCAGSCAVADAPEVVAPFSEAEFLEAVETWKTEPLGEPTLALETLLFHGAQTVGWLSVHGAQLEPERRAFLDHELARTDVQIEMRLVDEDGRRRGWLRSGTFPLKEKQHLVFEGTDALMRLETGGKVKRVGLAHLWSRW